LLAFSARTLANKGKREGRSCYAPALLWGSIGHYGQLSAPSLSSYQLDVPLANFGELRIGEVRGKPKRRSSLCFIAPPQTDSYVSRAMRL
jgi:hypothetical protein